jgi:hypothetical protein
VNWFGATSATNATAVDRRTNRCFLLPLLGPIATVLLTAGCGSKVPDGALVLTQTPTDSVAVASAQDILDERYPMGSRVVIALPPFRPGEVRVLSEGLAAAGGPVVSPSGKRIFLVGKAEAGRRAA